MISENKTSLVFQATNVHSADCGTPPALTNDPQHYCGYFENPFGEQWVFTYERDTKRGRLRGGDAGWDRVYPVVDGIAAGDLILGRDEALWLRACWAAATGTPASGPSDLLGQLVAMAQGSQRPTEAVRDLAKRLHDLADKMEAEGEQ